MKDRVTVVPADNVVIVDGLALCFPFDAPGNLHALQWYPESSRATGNGRGEMELTDAANRRLTEADYAEYVAPYVAAWEQERERRAAEADRQAAEARTPVRLAEAVRAERDARMAACDYLMMPDYPLAEEKRAAWAAYRQALRDLSGQAGFPQEVIWPDAPVQVTPAC